MKKRIFIIGAGPLPNEKDGIRDAAGLRTEQFIRPLQNAGHEIQLVLIVNSHVSKEIGESDGINFIRISRHDRHLMSKVKRTLDNINPDLCIGVNTFPAFIMSTCLANNCPFWADLNGWIMAEAQARSWSEDSNEIFANAWRQEKTILSKADKVSTVSQPQKFCVIGEMASLGILRKENFLEEKVFAIPNATKFFDIDKPIIDSQIDFNYSKKRIDFKEKNDQVISTDNVEDVENNKRKEEKKPCSQKILRDRKVPKNAFVISWIGGYNNWVDEKTLFDSVSKSMSINENIYFVSTGGAINAIADDTFGRFRQLIEKSVYKERFIFLGWIETEDMRKIYEESDLGINVDYKCIETESGARNRLNEMMKFGLPIVTTGESEIAEIIGKKKAGITVENGNTKQLSEAISKMAKMTWEDLSEYGKNGQHLSEKVFTDEQTLLPLLQYAQNPIKTQLSPLPLSSFFFYIQNIWWYIRKNNWKVIWGKIWQKIF